MIQFTRGKWKKAGLIIHGRLINLGGINEMRRRSQEVNWLKLFTLEFEDGGEEEL